MFSTILKNFCLFFLFVHYSVAVPYSTPKYSLIPCEDEFDCKIVKGTCKKGFCECSNSFNCPEISHTLVTKLGETCSSSEECNIESAVCNEENTCSCEKNYVMSHDKRKCFQAATSLGDSCTENVQCYTKIASSHCHQNKCVCQEHMHEYNGSCYQNVELDGSCQLIGECSITPNAICTRSKCECSENYVSNGSKCLLKANSLNSTCVEDIQCQVQLSKGAECFDGVCRCKEIYHYKTSNNTCVRDLLLNAICNVHSDCHQPGIGPSRLECVLGNCKCRSPFIEDDGHCMSSSTSVVLFKSFMLFLGTFFLIK